MTQVELKPPLQIGSIAPIFTLGSQAGVPVSLGEPSGKWHVLIFYLSDESESCKHELAEFNALRAEFEALNTQLLGIGVESTESHAALAKANELVFPLLSDTNGKVAAQYGVLRREQRPTGEAAFSLSRTTYLISPDFRVVKIYSDVSDLHHAKQVLADLKASPLLEAARTMQTHARVLLIPNVLPPVLCQELIDLWETENTESGFMKQIDGRTVGLLDPKHKIRRDHFMSAGPLQSRVQSHIGERVVPAVRKAFNYAVTRREDFRVACYDSASGGYFRPHRDNTTDGTAHRRFAMSLLLNDEYGGGYLRFPEFGRHTYRPVAGPAVIFSCSLLHEATDVTCGRRFVLLSFFYGDAEAKQREEYNKRTGGGYRT